MPAVIKSGYAFYTMTLPGMQRVDENGNKVNPGFSKERIIYLEIQSAAIFSVETVCYGDLVIKKFDVDPAQNPTNAGVDNKSGKVITIRAAKKFSLWKITIPATNVDGAREKMPILIKFKYQKKQFSFLIKNEIHLFAPDSY